MPQVPADRAHLRRAPRGARHRRRGALGPHPGDHAELRAGRRHAVLGPGLDPRQARPGLLPRDLRDPEGARDRLLLLCRWQRFVGHGAHRRRGGQGRQVPAALDPHPEDRGQRHRRERPHAGLPLGRPLRRAGLHGDQSRQQGAARRLHRRRHGPQCRLPHRLLGPGQEVPGRRAAPHLFARAQFRSRGFPP